MVDLWWIYGRFMVDLWWIYGGFMVDLWWIYGGFMVDLWWIDGGFMVDLWWIDGLIHGHLMGNTMTIMELYVGFSWTNHLFSWEFSQPLIGHIVGNMNQGSDLEDD